MKKYLSLLRGINISGQKLIKMTDLIDLYNLLGFNNAVTYLQSGNVIFNSGLTDKKKISNILAKGIKKKFGFDVSVLIKTRNDFLRIIKNNLFLKNSKTDTNKFYVTLLFELPDKKLSDELKEYSNGNDEFVIFEDIIYINCPDGYGRTKVNNNFFEKKLKITATTRNWNTINKLTELSGE